MTTLTKQDVVRIVRTETDDIRGDVKILKQNVGTLGDKVDTLGNRVGTLEHKVTHQGVLTEENNHILKGMAQTLDGAISQKGTVDDHQVRITNLERATGGMKEVVSNHSRQLRKLKRRD